MATSTPTGLRLPKTTSPNYFGAAEVAVAATEAMGPLEGPQVS
jgi:hypothetical protein